MAWLFSALLVVSVGAALWGSVFYLRKLLIAEQG